MMIFSYIFSLIGIGFLILIHELGHFLFCKLFNIPAPKFAIGMGPKIFKKLYKGTEYSVGIIPTGGYVAIGEETSTEDDKVKEGKIQEEVSILYKKKWYQGAFVLLGGISANLIFAYIVITTTIYLQPKTILNSHLRVFIPQKKIYLLDKENNLKSFQYKSALELIQETQTSEIFFLKDTENNEVGFNINDFKENNKIDYSSYEFSEDSIEKIKSGMKMTNFIIYQSFLSIVNLFRGLNLNKLSGPIGIFKSASDVAEKSFIEFILFLALISISLAVLNIVPIPIVDGGQLLLLSIYKLFGRGVPDFLQTILTYGSIGLIAIMTLYSTYNDIIRCFFYN